MLKIYQWSPGDWIKVLCMPGIQSSSLTCLSYSVLWLFIIDMIKEIILISKQWNNGCFKQFSAYWKMFTHVTWDFLELNNVFFVYLLCLNCLNLGFLVFYFGEHLTLLQDYSLILCSGIISGSDLEIIRNAKNWTRVCSL